MRILMCSPDYYGVEYEINPWMNIKQKVNHTVATQQWNTLYQTITECGAEVDLVDPVAGWPDMVFTANAGLPYDGKIILSHFKYKERQGELPYLEAWFKKQNIEILNPLAINANMPFFEGAGDALFAGEKLFAGFGFRTQFDFYKKASFLNPEQLIYCQLTDHYFYQLDTFFCPITENLAMWYPNAFSGDSKKRMEQEIELLIVAEDEAKQFACNAVVIDKDIILPTRCPQISGLLAARGFVVHQCEMTEFLKAGGACKCLTLKLD
jgi:N-dimethylarginine dimethylaminohydrolase